MNPYRRYIHNLDPEHRLAKEDQDSLKSLGYDGITLKELDRLFGSYETKILFGARHPAPCSAWRSERIQLGNEELPRFANHVHIYSRSDKGEYGRYLGFISLRPRGEERPEVPGYRDIAIAYIAPPRHMLRPRYHVITYPGGPAEGVLPFRCSLFCVPNPDTPNRASCLHAALHQALLLTMSRFGSVPISCQDMMAILWADTNQTPDTYDLLLEKGANLDEAEQLLRDDEVGAGALCESFKGKDFANDPEVGRKTAIREAHRCITDYLSNGLPLIVAYPDRSNAPGRSEGHAVLVLGMHLMRDPEDPVEPRFYDPAPESLSGEVDAAACLEEMELPGRFIVHDIMQRPYYEVSAFQLFEDAWISSEKHPEEAGVNFLAVGPWGMRLGVRQVRKAARRRLETIQLELWKDYLETFRIQVPDSISTEKVRLVTRLLQTSQVARRYLTQNTRGTTEPNKRALQALERGLTSEGQDRYWWCVEARVPWCLRLQEADRALPPAIVYIWSIEDGPNAASGPIPPSAPIHTLAPIPPPRLSVRYIQNGRARITAADGKPWEINCDLLPA